MTRRIGAAGPLMAGAILSLAVSAEAQAPGPFTGQSYNSDGAARGQVAFAQSCGRCHGANLAGGEFGPALAGAAFAGHWQGQSGGQLLSYIQTRMPPGGAGSLPPETYADLAAYIMKANGALAGAPGPVVAAAEPAPGGPRPTRTGLEARAQPKDAIALKVEAARKAKLDAIRPVTDAMLADPPAQDWLMWRRTYGVSGFSKLGQINKGNVAGLRQAWSWNIPVSQNETTPLVHDGVLFVTSGATIEALDGATGDLLWQYNRRILPTDLNGGQQHRNKGMAIWGDKLIADTVDKHVVALDIHTGKVVWDTAIAIPDAPTDPENVKPQTFGVPIVADGKVVVGVSLAIDTPSGNFIVALDANTGKEVWRFKTVAQPGEPGGDSWNGAPPSERYGAGLWTGGSYDPKRKLVFFGTGNTYDAGTLFPKKPGANNDALYTDTTLALDVETGKLKWHYQHVQRDVWDMDWVFEQSLATLPVDGKPRDVVLTAGKLAIFDVMDRDTGQYLFSKDLGLQNLIVAIDPKTGKKTTNPALEPESGKAKFLCPSSSGARSWPTTALDPQSHVVYVPMVETCANWTWTARPPEQVAKGGLDMSYPSAPRPNSDGNFGRLEAIDLNTRQVLWTERQRAGMTSSVLGLQSGIVFAGSMDRMFRAYDAKTGKVLWQTRLAASPSSSPISYAINGEQYVAVVAGGGGAFDTAAKPFTPEIDSPAPGLSVVVFKLPKAAGATAKKAAGGAKR